MEANSDCGFLSFRRNFVDLDSALGFLFVYAKLSGSSRNTALWAMAAPINPLAFNRDNLS